MFRLYILVTIYNTATICRAAPLLQPIFNTNSWPTLFSSYQQPFIIVPSMSIPAVLPMPMSPSLSMEIPNPVIKNSIRENTIKLKDLSGIKTDLRNDFNGNLPDVSQAMQSTDLQVLAALRRMQNNALAEAYMSQRWSVGDFINGISWLPIEVNIPDTVMGIYNGISSVIGSWAQRIPFINQITGGTPRPFKILTIGPDGEPNIVSFNMPPITRGIKGYSSYNSMIPQLSQV